MEDRDPVEELKRRWQRNYRIQVTITCIVFIVGLVAAWYKLVDKSPIMMVLTVTFLVLASISTLDKRLTQVKRASEAPESEPTLPWWTVVVIDIPYYGNMIAMLVLNWKYALAVIALMFMLASLTDLPEKAGYLFMRRFVRLW